ncbi:MAG: twin-arginine translocation signal domain-containing protein [Patescibacteria group bacterium]|jgi:hypothetical protein
MNKEKQITRRDFLKRTSLLVVSAAVTPLLRAESQDRSASGAFLAERRSEATNEVVRMNLSKDTLGARLLADNQEGEIAAPNFSQEGKEGEAGSYLVWKIPLSSVEGCQEVRKYKTYQVFPENELGPHSCSARAEVFYANWAKEGEGAWRVFVTGGNPSSGEWCSVLIADCDSQNAAKAVLGKLTEGGCPEGTWCTNINDCAKADGEMIISSIQACKEIEDICCKSK